MQIQYSLICERAFINLSETQEKKGEGEKFVERTMNFRWGSIVKDKRLPQEQKEFSM